MTLRPLFLPAILAAGFTTGLFAFAAQAHDPSLHEPSKPMTAKKVPTTCAQLADSARYSNDAANPDIKTLKARCDAEKAATARKAKAADKP